jgi:transposase
VDAGLRQIVFLDGEIKEVEKLIAQQALSWPEIRRLMTVPGVNLICAATFMGAIGRVDRFLTHAVHDRKIRCTKQESLPKAPTTERLHT